MLSTKLISKKNTNRVSRKGVIDMVDMVKIAQVVRDAKDKPEIRKELIKNPRDFLKKRGIDVPKEAEVSYKQAERGCGCYEGGAPVVGHVKVGWPG